MILNQGKIMIFFCTNWRLPPIRRVLCCLMFALPVLPAYAASPDSLPLPAAERNRPAAANKPIVPVPERGQLLYENHCLSCHTSVVHIRDRRSARSLEDIRKWTRRWAGELHLPWSAEEIDDVSHYLNARYYRYEQP